MTYSLCNPFVTFYCIPLLITLKLIGRMGIAMCFLKASSQRSSPSRVPMFRPLCKKNINPSFYTFIHTIFLCLQLPFIFLQNTIAKLFINFIFVLHERGHASPIFPRSLLISTFFNLEFQIIPLCYLKPNRMVCSHTAHFAIAINSFWSLTSPRRF